MRRLQRYRSFTTWLIPGLGVKRWVIILMMGITLISLGLAYLLRWAYVSGSYPQFMYYVTLQFLPHPARALIFGLVGIGLTVWGLLEVSRSLLGPFKRPVRAMSEATAIATAKRSF